MDKELKYEKLLKTQQEKPLPPRQGAVANQWDSVESDTESLAQERAYQQQLKMGIRQYDQNKYILPQKENVDTLSHGDGEDENVNDDEADLQVYDSLEVTAHPHDKRNPTLLQTEYLDTQIDKSKGTSQLLSDDAYSDLRYDPNWRINLKGAGRFTESSQMPMEEYFLHKEKARQSCGDRQGVIIKGGLSYIVSTSPAVMITPRSTDNESDQLDHLHAQDGQTSSVKSPNCHIYALQLISPETDLSRPSSFFTQNETDETSQGSFREECEKSCDHDGSGRSPELTEDVHRMYTEESKTYYQQDQRHTQGGATQTQQMTSSISTTPKVLSNRKLPRFKGDIVERNKITLGRNTAKCGSYMGMHGHKQAIPHHMNTVHETLTEVASTESQTTSSDPKQRWLQKTQQIRVTQISKGKKTQQKEYPSAPHQQQTPVLGARAEWGDCLSSPLSRPAVETQPKPQNTTSLQPITPTIHLNINLNTSSNLLPLLQQQEHDAIINLASLHGFPHWISASERELGLSPGYQQTNPGQSSQMFWKGVNALHHRNLERSPGQWIRTAPLKWPLSCEGEVQKRNPNELHTEQFPQNLLRSPTTTSPLGSGSYTVLPPIGQQMTGKEPEQRSGQSVNTAIHRSGSDGYLVQMEKQKQLRSKVTYKAELCRWFLSRKRLNHPAFLKAYSLKDYKQLKSDINLRGLGPDYTVIEKTKMKRQRLYSNVIREQNKKISRIPFLPAKDPEGNDKKVPRIKALEYAKTIAKPPVQSQPKQRQKHQSEGFTENTPCMEDLDGTQLATLEVLRRRHEEEKQAVALFKKVHAI